MGHSVEILAAQRIHALALGCEDLHDHAELCCDGALPLLVGQSDPPAGSVLGLAWICPSMLPRLELGAAAEAARDRCKRSALRCEAFDELLVELDGESQRREPEDIRLNLDATDAPLHGQQEGRFFHGRYGCYGDLPPCIFCGEHLLGARLRRTHREAADGSLAELQRVVGQLRRPGPGRGPTAGLRRGSAASPS